MSLEQIVIEQHRAWAFWKITETEEFLREAIPFREDVPASLTHAQKRLEWLAGRLLTYTLMTALDQPYQGIVKDAFGKPSPKGSTYRLSLSHSYPYVAAILDAHDTVGIDLEQPKEKLLRIAPRVLSPPELHDAGSDLIKHCIYWCAKEALIKIYGKKDLVLAKNIQINAFKRFSEGEIIGRLIVNGNESIIPLYYKVNAQFVMVFNKA
ncbi:MAG TPA: 4'-phosphopantetheinyl transferase superfamily protein [Ohtaekwangia sp.]|nr:4'-phosphopantetheinyl transferase superfamily protein [Ohtaekwangia sp.]